jgi:Na+/H+ antiporter NhaD/arsenite permease-like protein
MYEKYVTLIVFVLAYLLFVLMPRRRPFIAGGAAALLILLRVAAPRAAFLEYINWNVLGIFWGSAVVAELLMVSKMPAYVAERVVARCRTVTGAILVVCMFTSFLSAFVENVATVFIVAPIALAMADKLKVSPVPFLVALAISSNLQGTATLIGDPPSMILAGAMRMTFNDFFFFMGRPGIFFAVQIGAVVSFGVLYLFFRRYRQPAEALMQEEVATWVPTWMLITMIIALACSSFFDPEFRWAAGTICTVYGIGGLLWHRAKFRIGTVDMFRAIDWRTMLFLAGVFIIVECLTSVGWIDTVAAGVSQAVGSRYLASFCVIVALSVLLSAFIDNVPYLIATIPLVQRVAADTGAEPHMLYALLFGLLIGSCVGGNITPIGASANIVVAGMLDQRGYVVSFTQFGKIGLPFTIAATTAAAIFVWVVWG